MTELEVSKIAIRSLVEFVYRGGDLDQRFQGKSKAAEGIKIHQRIQSSQGIDYEKEVYLQREFEIIDDEDNCSFTLVISGRADGILKNDSVLILDEIKSTSSNLDEIEESTYPVHWAQAKIYAAIYCEENNLEEIVVQLTYAEFESLNVKRIRVSYKRDELISFMLETVSKYKKWVIARRRWIKKRNESIKILSFPFEAYRKGQREMAVSVYNAFKNSQNTFIEAPTGIGKTVSTLFPTLKAMNEGMLDKIFYLSAKAITKKVAEETAVMMANQGLRLRTLTITAKDKICFLDKAQCYPQKCEYAKGHYDRINDALWSLLEEEETFDRCTVELFARRFNICPYEFALDVALYSDVIICDYNYAFDPRVYLRRFFEVPSESFAFLVDEAHNLVDRARGMYSAELHKEKIMDIKKQLKNYDKEMLKQIEGINKMMLDIRKKCDEDGIYVDKDEISEIYSQLKRRTIAIEKWLVDSQSSEVFELVLDFYFDLLSYFRISELYDEGFLFYIINGNSNNTIFKLFCINPAINLMRCISKSRATVFFSATLSPIEYYRGLLSGDENAKCLKLDSPFNPDNRLVMFSEDVSVKFKEREDAISPICEYIYRMCRAKCGNYMVFLPSYKYLKEISDFFVTQYELEFDIIVQRREMNDEDKEDFLSSFENKRDEKSLICFAVLGGVFSEGIDLKGDLLIGVVVVGVGLPMISFENDLIKAYFDDENQSGFEYAYQYPGINKVMQGVGRVIRGENDLGVILLIDKRLSQRHYRRQLPRDWGNKQVNFQNAEKHIKTFWKEKGR